MGRHRLSQVALARASGLRPATLSALYHDRTNSISKATLARLLEGLRKLTGRAYRAGDLLHFRE